MAEFTEIVHEKCMAFADRIVKLNDYLLQIESKKEELRAKKEKRKAIPIYLHSVANTCNQLLRAGTSIGANNAEARESLYWIELLHRNKYLDEKQHDSIHGDCEELVRILVSRCKKLDLEA